MIFLRRPLELLRPLRLVFLGALIATSGCERNEDLIVRSIADAEHARIGVVTGSTPAQLAHERFPEARIQEFGDSVDTLGALKAGHIDVMLTSINAAILAARNNPGLAVRESSLRDETTAIAIRKGNDALRADVNRVLARLREDGTLADMSRRWFKRNPGPYETIEIELPQTGEPLRIGVNATREPFSFLDDKRQVSGHDGELARLLGHHLGRPIEFVDVRFDALIPGLQSGKMDLIVTGMSANAERSKFVDFSESYYNNKIVMLVRDPGGEAQETVAEPTGLQLRVPEDVAKLRIGVLQGSAFDTWVRVHYPEAKLLQFLTVADLFVAVEAGQVDASIGDADTLKEALKTRPGLAVLGAPVFSSEVGAGFRKDSAELRARFDAFLATIRADGTHADMERRWFDEADTRMPGIHFDPAAPALVVGISIGGLPDVAIKDNRLVGYSVELAQRFAASIGRRPEWATVDWGALIPSLAGGKTDLIVSGMFITPERRERIDFSEPYHRSENFVFVRASDVAGAAPAAAPAKASFWDGLVESFESNIIREDRYLLLWGGLKTTVLLSILSCLFGTVLGALICYMRMSSNTPVRRIAMVYISLMRGLPVLVLLMLIFYVLFASVNISPILVAVFAFGLNFAAYVSEMFRTGIESIDRGQAEAGVAMGFTRVGAFRHIVLPQALQRILPVYKGEFISMVKMTSIVGYVAVEDLTKASDIIRSRTFDAFFPLVVVAILYFLVSWVLIQALGYLERRTDPMQRRAAEARS